MRSAGNRNTRLRAGGARLIDMKLDYPLTPEQAEKAFFNGPLATLPLTEKRVREIVREELAWAKLKRRPGLLAGLFG